MSRHERYPAHVERLTHDRVEGWIECPGEAAVDPRVSVAVNGVLVATTLCSSEGDDRRRRFVLELPRPKRHKHLPSVVHVFQEASAGQRFTLSPGMQFFGGKTVRKPAFKRLFFLDVLRCERRWAERHFGPQYPPLRQLHLTGSLPPQKLTDDLLDQNDLVVSNHTATQVRSSSLTDFCWAVMFYPPEVFLEWRLQWLHRIGSDPESMEARHCPAELRIFAAQLAKIDMSSPNQLAACMDLASPVVRRQLDNRQTRYLLDPSTALVDDGVFELAAQRLCWFDAIATPDATQLVNTQLANQIGVDRSLDDKILPSDLQHGLLFGERHWQVLEPFIRYDRELYKLAHFVGNAPRAPSVRTRPIIDTGAKALESRLARSPSVVISRPMPSMVKTFVVLGVSRGGTSLAAGLLRLAGISMGQRVGIESHEDPEFHTEDIQELRKLVEVRNQQSKIWGWKHPHALDYLPKLKSRLRKPHYIAVFRDCLAVAQGFSRNHDIPVNEGVAEASRRYQQIAHFVERCEQPLLAISYEKALQQPAELVKELFDFCDVELDEETLQRCINFIRPGEYVRIRRPA